MNLEKKRITNNGIPQGLLDRQSNELDSLSGRPSDRPLEREKNDVIFTIRTNHNTHNECKAFFARRGLTVSRGVQIAIDYLMDQEEKGNIEVRPTGVRIK